MRSSSIAGERPLLPDVAWFGAEREGLLLEGGADPAAEWWFVVASRDCCAPLDWVVRRAVVNRGWLRVEVCAGAKKLGGVAGVHDRLNVISHRSRVGFTPTRWRPVS
jgi:hypothetical protein